MSCYSAGHQSQIITSSDGFRQIDVHIRIAKTADFCIIPGIDASKIICAETVILVLNGLTLSHISYILGFLNGFYRYTNILILRFIIGNVIIFLNYRSSFYYFILLCILVVTNLIILTCIRTSLCWFVNQSDLIIH